MSEVARRPEASSSVSVAPPPRGRPPLGEAGAARVASWLGLGWSRFDAALLGACALLPALLAATGATSAAPASHDESVVRVVGLGWTGLLRGLDAMIAAPLLMVPLGTRALRAGLASALVAGACGALAFVVARRLVMAVRPGAPPRSMSAVAAVGALTAVLAPIWQAEASAPGGAVVGAAIVLLAVAVGQRAASDGGAWRAVALVVGLAASYDPLVLAASLAALAPWIEGAIRARLARRRSLLDALPALALGLVPLAFAAALARRAPEIAISGARPFASAIGEGSGGLGGGALAGGAHAAARTAATGGHVPGSGGPANALLGAFAVSEIGWFVLAAAAAGAVLAALVPRARRAVVSLVGVVVVGVVAALLGAPVGPSRVAAAILAATCAVHLLAAVALAVAVVTIASARVPFAQASATLVVVLELVLPVRAADESLSRRESRAPHASAIWNEVAWGSAPPAAVVLVAEPTTMRRVAAARATGEMRGDLLFVAMFAMPSRAADRALKAEPKLAPLYRDLALGSTPEELSLATLATQRPLLAGFHPKWDRGLARHFVPVGLTTRFEPEPRGVSDRRKALDAFTPGKERLVRVAIARRDAELATATAALLRSRAVGMAASGERDVLSRALDDLRPFAPDDAVASTLVRRIVTNKGPIEVHDLAP